MRCLRWARVQYHRGSVRLRRGLAPGGRTARTKSAILPVLWVRMPRSHQVSALLRVASRVRSQSNRRRTRRVIGFDAREAEHGRDLQTGRPTGVGRMPDVFPSEIVFPRPRPESCVAVEDGRQKITGQAAISACTRSRGPHPGNIEGRLGLSPGLMQGEHQRTQSRTATIHSVHERGNVVNLVTIQITSLLTSGRWPRGESEKIGGGPLRACGEGLYSPVSVDHSRHGGDISRWW